MFSRLQRRRSNLQDLGRLSRSCPAVDNEEGEESNESSSSESWGSTASLSDHLAESGEEVSAPISRAEKQLARQSVRYAQQREKQQKRNMQQNKISMDDYLSKQAQFRLWLLEEQKKQTKDLSSPKRKTYFKMFVRLWNKRHLPDKFYESRPSWHIEGEAIPPAEKQSPLGRDRPKFTLLQNSPALDPTLFPHTIDLSADSIPTPSSSPSSFSTFGKSTPSTVPLIPFRFTGTGGRKAVSANQAPTTPLRSAGTDKRVSRFGENKENRKHFSLPTTAIGGENLRTATISPHKKMISACQDRSLDRMTVSWSPRGQPKLNPVDSPRCPSPFPMHPPSTTCNSTTTTKEDCIRSGCVSASFSSCDVYHQVKDVLASTSPTYAEIPAASSLDAALHLTSVGVAPKSRGHRRRSRSLDEAPVYAVPSKHSRDRALSEKQPVCEEMTSVSPPPVPPKRFDPHVEGLGIPFSTPDSAHKTSARPDVDQPPEDGKGAGGKGDAKKSSNPFKGKLPWFGRKLTSRRRSRSCEALSPAVLNGRETSRTSPLPKGNSPFPLVQLERSPTLGRRILTKPLKPPGHRHEGSHRKETKDPSCTKGGQKLATVSCQNNFNLRLGSSSLSGGQDQKADAKPSHGSKFELMEFSSSPLRPGVWGRLGMTGRTEDGTRRGALERRRSRSLELRPCAAVDRQVWSDSDNSKVLCVGHDSSWLQPDDWTEASQDTLPVSSSLQSPLTHPPSPHVSRSTNISRSDQGSDRSPSCALYEELKSEVRRDLSSLVQRLQQGSNNCDGVDPPDQPHHQPTFQAIEELQCSPQRLGRQLEPEVPPTTQHMDLDTLHPEDIHCGEGKRSSSNVPCDSLSSVVEGGGQAYEIPSCDVVMKEEIEEEQQTDIETDHDYHTEVQCTPNTEVTLQQDSHEVTTASIEATLQEDSHEVTTPNIEGILQEDSHEVTTPNIEGILQQDSHEVTSENITEESFHQGSNELKTGAYLTGNCGAVTVSVRTEETSVLVPLTKLPEPTHGDHISSPVTALLTEFPHPTHGDLTLPAIAPLTELTSKKHQVQNDLQPHICVSACPDHGPYGTQVTSSRPQNILSHETPSQREVVCPPSYREEVAFAVTLPTAQHVGQVSRLVRPSLRTRDSRRRRSRSVDETLSYVGSTVPVKVQMHTAQVVQIVSGGLQHCRSLVTKRSEEKDLVVKPQRADMMCPVQQGCDRPPQGLCETPQTHTATKGHYNATATVSMTPAPLKAVPEKMAMTRFTRNESHLLHDQTPVVLPIQPVTEDGVLSKGSAVTGNEVPPTVPKNAVTPTPATTQQQFARSAPPARHRRRSRSVGDMTAQEGGSGVYTGEGGGFASVRAFWDKLRGGVSEERGRGVMLQRKPSTMKRLQQQLFGAQGKEDREGQSDPSSPVNVASDPRHLNIAQFSPSGNTGAGVTALPSSANPGHQQHCEESVSHLPHVQDHTGNKPLPIQRSSFITVRRQSSRKGVASPGTPGADSPQTGQGQVKQEHPHTLALADEGVLTPTLNTPSERREREVKKKIADRDVYLKTTATGYTSLTPLGTPRELGSTQLMYSVSTGKKKPQPPPKPLPKPVYRPMIEVVHQQHSPSSLHPESSSTGLSSMEQDVAADTWPRSKGFRKGKRSCEEEASTGVVDKQMALEDGAGRRPVITTLDQDRGASGQSSLPSISHCFAGHEAGETNPNKSATSTRIRPMKRRSGDSASDLQPVKRRSSGKGKSRAAVIISAQHKRKQSPAPSLETKGDENWKEEKAVPPVDQRASDTTSTELTPMAGQSAFRGHSNIKDMSSTSTTKQTGEKNPSDTHNIRLSARIPSGGRVAVTTQDSNKSKAATSQNGGQSDVTTAEDRALVEELLSVLFEELRPEETTIRRDNSRRQSAGRGTPVSIVRGTPARRDSGRKESIGRGTPTRRDSGRKESNDRGTPVRSDSGRRQSAGRGTPVSIGRGTPVRSDSGRRQSGGRGTPVSTGRGTRRRQSGGRGTPTRRDSGRKESIGSGTPLRSDSSRKRSAGKATPVRTNSGRTESIGMGTPVRSGSSRRQSAERETPVRSSSSQGQDVEQNKQQGQVSRQGHTTSSAKRRSGGGGAIITAASKRSSVGNSKARRDSSTVKRADSKRGHKAGESQPNTSSRSSSFRRCGSRPPQSPTFRRLTRNLGVHEEQSSHVAGGGVTVDDELAQKIIAGLQKAQAGTEEGDGDLVMTGKLQQPQWRTQTQGMALGQGMWGTRAGHDAGLDQGPGKRSRGDNMETDIDSQEKSTPSSETGEVSAAPFSTMV